MVETRRTMMIQNRGDFMMFSPLREEMSRITR